MYVSVRVDEGGVETGRNTSPRAFFFTQSEAVRLTANKPLLDDGEQHFALAGCDQIRLIGARPH